MIWFFVILLGLFAFFIKKRNDDVSFNEQDYERWKSNQVSSNKNLVSSLIKDIKTYDFDKALRFLRAKCSKKEKDIFFVDVENQSNIFEGDFSGYGLKDFPASKRKLLGMSGLNDKIYNALENYSNFIFRNLSVKGYSVQDLGFILNYVYLFSLDERNYPCFYFFKKDLYSFHNFRFYYDGGKRVYIYVVDKFFVFSFDDSDRALLFLMEMLNMVRFLNDNLKLFISDYAEEKK